jgi:hypothetical protein
MQRNLYIIFFRERKMQMVMVNTIILMLRLDLRIQLYKEFIKSTTLNNSFLSFISIKPSLEERLESNFP